MARVLHGISVGTLPEPGELNRDDQVIAYRQSDGVAYRTDVGNLATEGVDVLNKVYPVGSIYMSVVNSSPEEFLGGTWTRIEDRFLLAAGNHEAGETGGEETVALSTTELPAHSHSLPSHTHSLPSHTHSTPSHTHSFSATTSSNGSHTHSYLYLSNLQTGGTGTRINSAGTSTGSGAIEAAGAHTHTVSGTTGASSGTTGSTSGTSGSASGTSGETGQGNGHNNMPPYLSVYMWQRVA